MSPYGKEQLWPISDIFCKQKVLSCLYRAFSYDVRMAILVYQANPVGVEVFSYVNTFFCSNKFTPAGQVSKNSL